MHLYVCIPCICMWVYGKRNILYLVTVTFRLFSPGTIRDILILCTTNIASCNNINFWLHMPVKLAIHHHTVLLRWYSSLRKTASMGLRYPIVNTSVAWNNKMMEDLLLNNDCYFDSITSLSFGVAWIAATSVIRFKKIFHNNTLINNIQSHIPHR